MPRPPSSSGGFIDFDALIRMLQAALPDILTEMADLFGAPKSKLKKLDIAKLGKRVPRMVGAVQPYLVGLAAVTGGIEMGHALYVLIEGMLRSIFRQHGTCPKKGEDALGVLIRKIGEGAQPDRRLRRVPDYMKAVEGIEALIKDVLAVDGRKGHAHQLFEDYHTKHGREQVKYIASLPTRLRRYRESLPRRFTMKAFLQLTDELRDSAGMFERRLRLLVGLNAIADGKPLRYEELLSRNLGALLQAVDSPNNSRLHFLKNTINRHIRNALSHGCGEPSILKGQVRFVDRSTDGKEHEVLMPLADFYTATRKVTLAVIAFIHLDAIFQARGYELLLRELLSMNTRTLHGVHLAVRSLRASVPFYRAILGPEQWGTDSQGAALASFKGLNQRVVLHEVPDAVPPPNPRSAALVEVVVKELRPILADLVRLKAKISGGKHDATGVTAFTAVDPDGYRVTVVRFGAAP